MARYGDHSEFEIPQGLKAETNADMSFTGISTTIKSKFFIRPKETGIPFFEREHSPFNFEQLCNISATIEHVIFSQVAKRTQIALEWCERNSIPLTTLVK
jgi:tRNA A37 threonylcarbamoyltransferase TsaD